MLQWLGALLIVAASSGLGWRVARNLAERPAQLAELRAALSLLESEMSYGQRPLPAVLASAAQVAGGVAGDLCLRTAALLADGEGRTAGEALRAALIQLSPRLAPTPADLRPLYDLGAVLGASGTQDQIRQLRICGERLGRVERETRLAQGRYERVARYLGVLGGIALVLLLL